MQDVPPAEFASDAFDSSTLNPDDLEREMRELGMDGDGTDIPAWEHELQKELQVLSRWRADVSCHFDHCKSFFFATNAWKCQPRPACVSEQLF